MNIIALDMKIHYLYGLFHFIRRWNGLFGSCVLFYYCLI